jgi:hypothetical protein
MHAHGRGRALHITLDDGVDDGFVLLDEDAHMQLLDAEIAHAVHLGLHLLDDAPGIGLACHVGEGSVKMLVQLHEGIGIVFEDILLGGNLALQFRLDRRVAPFGDELDDVGLDRLAHEARIHHGLGGDARDHRAALGADLHEPGFGELDECLANRLTRHVVGAGDFGLGDELARNELGAHDALTQMTIKLRRNGCRTIDLVHPSRQHVVQAHSSLRKLSTILPY